ncbi:MAG: DUF1464 family protein [Solirubrobacterales bacterium]|nr:DUF1464 family protein [Solirubrobacterales bacterium]
MPRVAGVDPGTVSFDLCVLQDGVAEVEREFETRGGLGGIVGELSRHGPYDLVYGPSGYGLPLVGAADVGERELAEMVLVVPREAARERGIGGMRALLRELAGSGLPLVFGPGVIHLPSVPAHRKYNRIDMGTADKVCAAASAVADQAARRGVGPADTSLVLLELGGAFAAALAIAGGAIVDGVGGSSGPIGVRAVGALDGELAYLLGDALTKQTLFTGGALDPDGVGRIEDFARAWDAEEDREGWTALLESAAKAVRALRVALPEPHEIVVSGRVGRVPGVVAALGALLYDVAPVTAPPPGPGSAAARGAALLADGLAGGARAPLVEAMRLREATGSVLHHLRVAGAGSIVLG